MLDKLIVLYSFIITLNPAIKLCAASDFGKNATSVPQRRLLNTFRSSVTETEDTWQPIIPKHNWLAEPTNLTPALSVSTTPTRTSSASWHSTNVKNNLANNLKQKHRGYVKPQTYHNYANTHQHHHHHNGNYSKRHINTSMSTASSSASTSTLASSSAPSQSIKNIKLRSHNKTSRGRGKTQLSSHHQQQQQLYPLNNIETLYPQIQIPKDIISQVQEQQQQQQPLPLSHQNKYGMNLISSQLNSNHVDNVAQYKHHNTTPSSSTSYWDYLPQLQHEANHLNSLTPKIDTSNASTTSSTNSNVKTNTFPDKENVKNSTSSILTNTLNSFAANENLIDNEITNTKTHQHHNHHHHYKTLHHSGVKSIKISNDADKNLTKATKSNSTDSAAVAAADNEENFNVKLLLLRKTLNNAQAFYDNIKDIILSYKDNNSADSRSDDDDEGDDDYDILYSTEDKTNDDNDLQILNSSTYQALKDPSTTAAAVIAAAMDSFNMKNMLFSSASIGEVQGHQRQIDKDTMKYPSSQDTSQMQNIAVKATATNDTQATGRLWNLSTKIKTAKHSSSLSPSLTASTSKALTAISSGRKVKKVKKKFKKFQKFLLPLVLAYKLKFMALIPLLIGGLTLLVGTTGLAGFFFALFTAVMSLKTGSRNAIVVKKY